MITFAYKAKNPANGELVSAEVQADNEHAAAKLLIGQGLYPISIEDRDAKKNIATLSFGNPVKTKDRVIFTRQLSTLVNAGLPLTQSLRIASEQINNKNLHEAIAQVIVSVEGGSTLSNSLSQYPKIFNEIYVNLVAAGETSGTLDKALERIASQQEKDAAILSKIRGALVYPVIVLVVILAVLVFMLTTVLPQVGSLYNDLHKELPLMTKILIAIAGFIQHDWWFVLLLVVGAVIGLRAYAASASGRRQFDQIKLSAPLFGRMFQKVYMARFSRTLATLLGSGIPLLDALSTVSKAMNNTIVEDSISGSIAKVRGGKALSASLEGSKGFTQLVPQMIRVGEQSGAIDGMLEKVAGYYEEEVDNEIKNLSTTIEPVLMVVLGAVVGIVIAAVLLPVYGLIGSGGISNLG